MKESVLSFKEKKVFLLSSCLQVLTIFYDWPVKYDLWQFIYMITKL